MAFDWYDACLIKALGVAFGWYDDCRIKAFLFHPNAINLLYFYVYIHGPSVKMIIVPLYAIDVERQILYIKIIVKYLYDVTSK